MTDAEALGRFIREAARLDPELARWTAACVWRGLSRARRRRMRDELLREAARLLPPTSAWAKAAAIAAFTRRGARPDAGSPAGLVALALAVYPGRSGRLRAAHAYRIVFLSRSPKCPVELRDAAAVESIPMDLFRTVKGEP